MGWNWSGPCLHCQSDGLAWDLCPRVCLREREDGLHFEGQSVHGARGVLVLQ